jgi:hypothetical protein
MKIHGIFLILTVSALSIVCIGFAAAVPDLPAPPDNRSLVMDITSPLEDDVIYYDVVPGYLSVEGKIYGSDDIRNVTVTYGNESSECGKKHGTYFDVSCKFLIHNTIKKITIDVMDNQGSVTSETRNFTHYLGPPPPGTIFVYGTVVDTNGNPVGGAILTFETEIKDYGPFSVNTTTNKNGKFSMKKTYGYQQKITVKKAGYQTLVQDVTFKPGGNDKNFTLSPQKSSASGFDFPVSVFAIMMSSLIIYLHRGEKYK